MGHYNTPADVATSNIPPKFYIAHGATQALPKSLPVFSRQQQAGLSINVNRHH